MSLLPGLLFTRRSAGAESAGGRFATHPGPQEAHFPLVQWQQEDKITTAPLTSCPAMYPVCVCLTLSRHVLNSPEEPSTPCVTWARTSTAKQAQTDLEVQTTFPGGMNPKTTCSLLCLPNLTSYCREAVCTPCGGLLSHEREE